MNQHKRQVSTILRCGLGVSCLALSRYGSAFSFTVVLQTVLKRSLVFMGITLVVGPAFLPPLIAQTVVPFQPRVRWGGRSVAVSVNPANPQQAMVATERGGL